MKLVLVRHGQSVWNKENLFTGWHDIDLSSQGVMEAKEAGIKLKEAGYEFDVVYTSLQKRAIHTGNYILDEMDRVWLPTIKSFHLNERHYGALQGLNKEEVASKYGDEQVFIWRRSYDTPPPVMELDHPEHPSHLKMYQNVDVEFNKPFSESLKDTYNRCIPYFNEEIVPRLKNNENILVVAHGNTIRAIVKYLESVGDDEISELNIPTGTPLVYELDGALNVLKKYYL